MFIMLILVSCGKESEKVKLIETHNIHGLEEYKPASELTSSFGLCDHEVCTWFTDIYFHKTPIYINYFFNLAVLEFTR